jgi:uncharacterized membrane protein YebE (DUF533 family)
MFRPVLTSTLHARAQDPTRAGSGNRKGARNLNAEPPTNSTTKSTLTAQEALIYAMVTVAAADRVMAEKELARMNTMIRELPAFRNVDDAWLIREAQDCGKLLGKPDGITKVVRLIVEALPGELHETAYALAAEIAASDLAIKDDERNFLALLGDALRLDHLVRAALERSAYARHKTA